MKKILFGEIGDGEQEQEQDVAPKTPIAESPDLGKKKTWARSLVLWTLVVLALLYGPRVALLLHHNQQRAITEIAIQWIIVSFAFGMAAWCFGALVDFISSKRKDRAASDLDDEDLYEEALNHIRCESHDKATLAKAIAESKGNRDMVDSIYIRLYVQK
mgnify:CR=1 FL=1